MPYMVQYMHSKQTSIPYICRISKKIEFEKKVGIAIKVRKQVIKLEPIRNIQLCNYNATVCKC